MKKWAEIRENSPQDFLPLSFELFGGCHPESEVAINRLGRLAAIATASDVAATRGRLWQRLSVEIYKGVANAIEPRTSAILMDDDFGGAPRFELSSPQSQSKGPVAILPNSRSSNKFLVCSSWFTDSRAKTQQILNSSPFFVLQKFLDNKSLVNLCVCKPILANIFHIFSLRRQSYFWRKANPRELVFGDPKHSRLPLFNFFENFTDLLSVASVNKMTRELLCRFC